MDAIRVRLGALCDQVSRHPDMDEAIRASGAGAELDELLTDMNNTQNPDPARTIELLDAIEVACARDGLPGVTVGTKQYVPLPGGFRGVGQNEPPTWICPLRKCARVVFDDETTAPPSCAASGGDPMVPTRIL